MMRRLDSARSLETAAALDVAATQATTNLKELTVTNGSSVTSIHNIALTKAHLDAVVKVFCTHASPSFSIMWQHRSQTASTSTGFCISGPNDERWVLTNAHSVTHHTAVKLKRRGSDVRFKATVLSIGRECDIALLRVDDDAFWDGIEPIHFGVMPQLQDSVACVGYPIGGASLSVSVGVVSRVEITSYSHGCFSLLAMQIDAAINSGNSGGPVFNAAGECVGIAFQAYNRKESEGIGFVIPTTVVAHFLRDYMDNGTYIGFPSLNVVWQDMESPALRRAYGMDAEDKGVLVREIPATSHEAELLRVEDVILAIDDVKVANDGTVPFRNGERVNFKYLVTQKHIGETLGLQLLRDGKRLTVDIVLSRYQYLVPPHLGNEKPSYLVVGGLVFTPLTDPYLEARFGSLSAAPVRLATATYYGKKQRPDHEVVLLSSVLSSAATVGYEATRDAMVTAFNGVQLDNLRHLAQLVSACTGPYMRFELDAANKVVVLDTAAARAATEQVMEENSIPAACSKDLADVLA